MGKKNLKPIFFKSKNDLPAGTEVVDAYTRSVEELFYIENPRYKKEMPEAAALSAKFVKSFKSPGVYIYFPWRKSAVYTVQEDIYFSLRTARNRDIITGPEQEKFRNKTLGIVGLSVGSVVLSAIAANGGPKNLKIADFDDIEITNLNRMRATVLDIGQNKAFTAAKNIWELDPYADIDIWDRGVKTDTLEKFIDGTPALDVFIDTMDSLDLKILARFFCRKAKIPVIMVTENGDNSIIDIERYDLDTKLPIFHGRIGDPKPDDFKSLKYRDWLRLASMIVGAEYLSPEMQSSIMKLGKSIASVPQLSTSVSIGASAACAVIRRILTGKDMPTGRYLINLDREIIPLYDSEKSVKERELQTRKFIARMSRG